VTIRLATGIARREGRVLLVASRYANHERPLWTLPGGRQEADELASETVVREVREETGLAARVDDLAYFSESYDAKTHVVNATYAIEVSGDLRPASASDHVVGVEWLTVDEVRERMTVAVVREPLLAYLRGEQRRYYGFHDAGVTIQWLE
jgi:8-oxo-dGTP diphosphatase